MTGRSAIKQKVVAFIDNEPEWAMPAFGRWLERIKGDNRIRLLSEEPHDLAATTLAVLITLGVGQAADEVKDGCRATSSTPSPCSW